MIGEGTGVVADVYRALADWLVGGCSDGMGADAAGACRDRVVIVPDDPEPPTTPSTNQVTFPKPVAVNCCV